MPGPSKAEQENATAADHINSEPASRLAGRKAFCGRQYGLDSSPGLSEVHDYLDYARVEKGLAANSISNYQRDLVHFYRFLRGRGKSFAEADRDDVRAFLAALYRRGLSARSVARHLISLRNFFRFLMQADSIHTDPTAEIDAPKLEQTLPRYLTTEEVDVLLRQPDISTPLGLRDKAMIEFLYATGMRVSELVHSRWSDFDSGLGVVRCVG